MTPAQKARLVGFTASLKLRGVSLTLRGTRYSFTALVEQTAPEHGEFSLSNETRTGSRVHIPRDSEGVDQILVGSVLANEGAAHRVTTVEDHPTNIAMMFVCESA